MIRFNDYIMASSNTLKGFIDEIPREYEEAALIDGYTRFQAFYKVVLPQALHNMLPSMVSQFVSTIKETSLGYVISAHEMTFAASQVNNVLLTQPFEVYSILALTYFALCSALTWLARLIERRISTKQNAASTATIAA